MSYRKPEEIAHITAAMGEKKANMRPLQACTLGFLAGAFIALGFLLYLRVAAGVPAAWSGLGSFLGAALFPIGLILTIIAGGELLTGNMMAVPLARLQGKITTKQLTVNWLLITLSNFAGALFVAYLFGHVVGLTEAEPYLSKLVKVAGAKLDESFLQAFISGIGCNWLVALAVWLAYGADDVAGKMLGIWFPTMTFVAIGFQHVVANMFLIPAAIFAGHYTWLEYLGNFVPVFLGNAVGGSVFVATAYWLAYLRANEKAVLNREAALPQSQPLPTNERAVAEGKA
ncbi:formate/nitrite transporter [Paenibacillus tyrfis]|uniref:formate/nitrite transporter family protein n=1 Tax=Paenibacillus tyrfis TaxID=1501230 RepID=UPI002492B2F7|nr:formate/nitrite transporter family protein [Paenibacillus tyrfis]GLI06263.1 formate/nitrite transporter [Paenibacillus tyrfis]